MNLSLLIIIFVVGARSSISIEVDNMPGIIVCLSTSVSASIILCVIRAHMLSVKGRKTRITFRCERRS